MFSFSFSSYFEFTAIGSRPFLGVEAVNNGAHPSVLGIRAKAMRVYFFFVVEGEFEKDEKKTKKTKRCGGKSTARHLFRGPVPEKKRIASVIRAEKGNGSRGT